MFRPSIQWISLVVCVGLFMASEATAQSDKPNIDRVADEGAIFTDYYSEKFLNQFGPRDVVHWRAQRDPLHHR